MSIFKKSLSLVLAFTMMFMLAIPVSADSTGIEPGSKRVTVGADLSENQILSVYKDFQVVRGSVTELKVTNAEEREYLEGIVSESTIGSRSISCIYIETLEEGQGLDVSTYNINWCTDAIYSNALITVGIYDAKVIVSAPFAVSGTAALTGIYKAYEDISGEELSEEAKTAGTLEMVLTSELAEDIGDEEATEIVNELKLILDKTKDMTDEELREEIENIADERETTLTSEQIDKLIELVRGLEGLDFSSITDKLKELAGESGGFFATLWDGILNFFKSIGDFFSNIFGGGNSGEESSVNTSEVSSNSDEDNTAEVGGSEETGDIDPVTEAQTDDQDIDKGSSDEATDASSIQNSTDGDTVE